MIFKKSKNENLNKNLGDAQRYKAFTLSEVVITLGIIGVVVAMTIPALINNIQEQAYLNQFKKVYTEMSQAYIQAAQDNGIVTTWDSASQCYDYIKPYLAVAQDCPMSNGCFISGDIYKQLNGTLWGINLSNGNWYKLRLKNGCSILFSGVYLGDLVVDINGEKKPNQFGMDVFYINLGQKNNSPVVTWGTRTSSNYCKKNIVTGDNGASCSYWILKHWNMDYLHRDISDEEWNQ